MALIFMDSFDHYSTADINEKWTSVGATTPQISAAGRFASAMYFPNSAAASYIINSTPHSVCIIGFAVRFSALVQRVFFATASGANIQTSLQLNSDGTLSVYRGAAVGTSGSTLIGGPTSFALTPNIYYHIQVKIVHHGTTGAVEIRVNNDPKLTLSPVNTVTSGTTWGTIHFGTSSAGPNFNIDDLYLCDGNGAAPWNNFLGDCRVDYSYPNGAGATTAWTASSAGNLNYNMVDETVPNDDSDYNAAGGVGLVDTFKVQDLSAVGAPILGVQLNISARKNDVGLCAVAPVYRPAGSSSDIVGASASLGNGYKYITQMYQTNPFTGDQWTESEFNGAEFGYSRTI